MRVYLKGVDLLGFDNRKKKVIFDKNQMVRCSRCKIVFLFGDFAGHKCLRVHWKKPWEWLEVIISDNRKAIMLS